MLNSKVIVINGLGRGGSNILWNILGSHPAVCLPLYEMSEIVGRVPLLKYVLRSRMGRSGMLRGFCASLFDRRCFKLKVGCLRDDDHRMRSESEAYSEAEIRDTALCLKSLNEDISLTDFLESVYEDISFFGLVRNGYALCEGMIRRGITAEEAGRIYHRDVGLMIEQEAGSTKYMLLKFEDVLSDPFGVSQQIFGLLDLRPISIPKIRLKSKGTQRKDGSYGHRFGKPNRHYWFDREEIVEVLDPNIDAIQSEKLSPADRKAFERQAGAELEHFGYV